MPHISVAPVAVCVAGQSRTLHACAALIEQSMIRPIRGHADVYLALGPSDNEEAHQELHSHLHAMFAPVRQRYVVSTRQTDGLLVCMGDIKAREREHGNMHRWVLRLRPDVVYPGWKLPPYSAWPLWLHSQFPNASVLFVPDSSAQAYKRSGRLQVQDAWAVR